jgi:predicted membrane-bound spermidine synthase
VLYELVWLRLAMAQFGVTTAMVSIVLSVFMAGLGLGSWASGRWLSAPEFSSRSGQLPALRIYALVELLIGVSGIAVPYVFLWGRNFLEHSALSSSAGYYSVTGLWVGISLIPGCALMGATVPIAMRAIAQTVPAEARRSFSYLYTANVAGAVAGTHVPLFLIELLGFRGTLRVGFACNCAIAIAAYALSSRRRQAGSDREQRSSPTPAGKNTSTVSILGLLFLSGLTCMAMEVIWVRCYTPYFGTVVYAFASILGIYLLGTFIGSVIYRRWSRRGVTENPIVWSALATCALLPLIAASPLVEMDSLLRLELGVGGFTGLLGFITPMLVDRFSSGDPGKAGTAYAVNVLGCILGPLLAGFVLLPYISERWALIVLAIPWLVLGLAPLRPGSRARLSLRLAVCSLLAVSIWLMVVGKGYEARFSSYRVLRDPTATVIAAGSGMDRRLLVNGFGITNLTPITKWMAHLPLAMLDHPPKDALVICFGMGTTFRSLRSWNIPVTAAELVPSVPRLFSYYHSDAQEILASPLAHVVIDDGRRFLERTQAQYDVITIDPPPPLQAAGSSLLYSKEFYSVVKRHLRPGGILQQWLPATSGADPIDVAAVARSIRESFPDVRVFRDEFGLHFLCSEQPLPQSSAAELIQKMPASALIDLTEWSPPPYSGTTEHGKVIAYSRLNALLAHEIALDQLIAAAPATPAITDDRPVNEYYILRKWFRADRALAAAR